MVTEHAPDQQTRQQAEQPAGAAGEQVRLAELVEFVIDSGTVGVAKPDPQFFAYNRGRQAAFGYKFDEILHTAQSQYHDIGIAMALGYATCWIERRRGQNGFGATPVPAKVTTPTFCFPTLAALADAVEAELAPV